MSIATAVGNGTGCASRVATNLPRSGKDTSFKLNPGSVTARIVVVSGGSIGSTELLLRCQKQHKSLPNLGRMLGGKWCTNANYLSPAFHAGRKVYPSRGPTITAGIRFFGDNNYKGSRFMIEDGGVPDLLFQYRENLKNPSGDAQKFAQPLYSPTYLCNFAVGRKRTPESGQRAALTCQHHTDAGYLFARDTYDATGCVGQN